MSMKPKHLFRNAVTTQALVLLVLSISHQCMAQQAPENEWHFENATATTVPSFKQSVDGQWIERKPRSTNTFLELRGTLDVAGDGSFGPNSLADAVLLAGANAVPVAAELIAVGVRGGLECFYLRAPIGTGSDTTVELRSGGDFSIMRENGSTGTLFLRTRAPTLDLCVLFELVEMPTAPLLWHFANRAIPLAIASPPPGAAADLPVDSAGAAPLTSAAPSPVVPQAWQQAVSSPLLWGGLALTALLAGIAVQRMRRQLANGSRPASASALDIPRVSAVHQPTRFARVETETGPGQQQFQDALAALRLEDWVQARELFGEAIAAGLTATFEAGAWSLRGEATLNCDDLVGAATCFLRALSSPGVTTEAALPAASQMAAIYRELRLKRDARKMEKLKAVVNPFAGDLGPQRLALIARLVSALKHRKRARILASFRP